MNQPISGRRFESLAQKQSNKIKPRQMIRSKCDIRKTKNVSKHDFKLNRDKWRSLHDIKQHESTEASLMSVSIDRSLRARSSVRAIGHDKLPMVLFNTAGEENIPGPGAYDISNGDILDRMKKGFGITMRSRHDLTQSCDKTPGPGSYDILQVKPRYNKNAFTIAKAIREGKLYSKDQKIPGPLNYTPNMTYKIKGTVPFGNTMAPKLKSDTPGPGTYEAKYQQRRIPKFHFNMSKRFLNKSADDLRDGQGPSGYQPNIDSVRSKKPSAHISIAKRTDSGFNSCSPGVGKYVPESYKPKYSGGVIFSNERRFYSKLQIFQK